MNKNKSVSIITLGCRVNQYESCVIAERLQERGFDIVKDNSDYYIVNTCAVTSESERKSRQMVRRCASKGKTLVMGCASQLEQKYVDINNVIYVGGNRNKSAVVDVLCGVECDLNNVISMDGAPYEEMNLMSKSELFSECRAFVKIQDGCNGKCTYCIIPKCRGRVRSRDANAVISEAERLVQNGYKELILTGIEVGAYNSVPLHELICSLSNVCGLERLRLGSLSPNVISEKFLQAVSKCENFMPHIHLSLQSCNDRVLRAMMRPYTKADIIKRVALIKAYIPNCMISADIIVGFPGETEEEFEETLNTLNELQIFHVHSFPYSERKGTVAAAMPNSVPKHIRVERNNRLIEANTATRMHIFEKFIGKNVRVLVEKVSCGRAHGHTEEFIEAEFECKDISIGEIVNIKICSYDKNKLFGTISSEVNK